MASSDVFRHGADEAGKVFARSGGTGGVVRVGDENHPGGRSNGGEHRVKVVAVVLRGHGDELRAEQRGNDGIHRETILRDDHLCAGGQKRVADKFEHFIRAVAQDDVGRADAELGGEFLLEVEGIAVRVEIHFRQGLAHGGQGESGGTQGIFVGRELDDIVSRQAEFAGDFFDGSARLINWQVGKDGISGEGQGHGVSMYC